MIFLTTVVLLILRFLTESDTPSTTTTEPPETNDEDKNQWVTREQFTNFRSAVENRLDRLIETMTGGEPEEPESKRRTLLTPASVDDELTQSQSTTEPPTLTDQTTAPPENESSAPLMPKRNRAIWEKTPPMRHENAVAPVGQKTGFLARMKKRDS